MAILPEFVRIGLWSGTGKNKPATREKLVMKIIIMTGRFGMGHYSVAQALKEDLEQSDQEATVEVIDILEYLLPSFNKVIYGAFHLLVSRCSGMYNSLNKTAERYNSIPFKGLIVRKIGELLDRYEPDLIISTLPISTKYVSAYKEETQCSLPLITYITDICAHQEWIAEESDYYFVGSEEVKEELVEKGIQRGRIYVSGIPVRKAFQNKYRTKKSAGKKELLIMGGGFGLIPSSQKVFEALNQREDIHTTVITGTNKKLFDQLSLEYNNLNIVGYTDKVDEYLAKADLLISKAGGITLFEALSCETPMFVIHPFLQQEVSNAKYMDEKGFGKIIWDKEANVVEQLFELLNNDIEMKRIRQNMHYFKETTVDNTIVKQIIASYAVA